VTTPPSVLHLAMGFSRAPTLPQLKRYVAGPANPVDLRKLAMLEATLRTGRKVTYLRSVADSGEYPEELRQAAREAIATTQLLRTGRALFRRFGLW
jgi:hypothetical protein